MSDLLLLLGNKNLSSWSLRPWLLMRHAGIPFRERVHLLPAMQAWERDAMAEVEALRASAAVDEPKRTPDPRSAEHAYAVSSQRTDRAQESYAEDARAMEELAAKQPGFLGIESARSPDGFGITVSYWESLEAIRAWKHEPSHTAVQARGKKSFHERYEVRVAVVERGYKFPS